MRSPALAPGTGISRAVRRLRTPSKKVLALDADGTLFDFKTAMRRSLALALAADGASVGLLDADIYGPSQPRMLGVSGQPESADGKTLEPMMSYHVQTMSIGFLVDEETPMIWRGPMVTQALQQLLRDTRWKSLAGIYME